MLNYQIESRALIRENEECRKQLSRRFQTDGLFAAWVLGYSKMLPRVHGPVAEFCVQKNPDLPLEEQDVVYKERLHLDPRGTFKSTWSIIDSVQWITCFPEVRICKLTATKPLAVAIAGEITDHFVKGQHAEPTLFQELFPEFVITPREKRVGEFTAPCRKRQWREATVMAFSIETSISGWHFDVMDPDDVVDTQNSKTPGSIALVKSNWGINKKTLMPWGYVNYKGTRYNPFDLWGQIIKHSDPARVKSLIRSALTLNNGKRLEPGEFPAAEDMTLLFPELLSYEFLKSQFEEDYGSFMTQYMNVASGGNVVIFPKELLLQATVGAERAPISGQVTIAWRLQCSSKPGMGYAGAAVGISDHGRMYVVDAVSGIFPPSTLAHRIVTLAKKWGTHEVQIEETPGARYAEAAIQNYGLTANWPVTVRWVEFQEDDAARDHRIKSAEPLLTASRLLLSAGMGCRKEAFEQLENYGMTEQTELADVIARLGDTLPRSIAADEDRAQDAAFELLRERDLYDRTHGLGVYAPVIGAEPEQPYSPPGNSLGLPELAPGLNA